MSGHSKWSKIKRKKEATDAKKSAVFTKFSSEIVSAINQGGADPASNASLRDIIDRAKKGGVPQANIDRLLNRSSGQNMQTVTYEGFGPAGVGLIIIANTDNTNRTVSEIRNILKNHNASLGSPNSVMWKFTKKDAGFTPIHPLKLDPANQEKLASLVTKLTNHPDVEHVYTDAA